MILTFKELGINAADYNGQTISMASALIINVACDYVMAKVIKDTSVDESDAIPFPKNANVNMVTQMVTMYVNMDAVTIH